MQLSHMIPGVTIISKKASIASVNGTGGVWKLSETPAGSLRKFAGTKKHLNWLKIDLNATEIITIQDYKHPQN